MSRGFTVVFLTLLACLGSAQLKGKVICIDPGHPSEVGRGTQGRKLTEIGVAWRQAQLVKARLEKMGAKVVLTKHAEQKLVRNRARAEVANNAHADLMLRLHCDAASGSGFTSYYPTQQGKSEGVTGPSKDLIARIAPIAKRFHAALSASLRGKLNDLGLKSDMATAVGHKQGALTGSVFSKVPVVLVEMVVLTNPKDEAFIGSAAGEAAMADALAAGVVAALKQ